MNQTNKENFLPTSSSPSLLPSLPFFFPNFLLSVFLFLVNITDFNILFHYKSLHVGAA